MMTKTIPSIQALDSEDEPRVMNSTWDPTNKEQ